MTCPSVPLCSLLLAGSFAVLAEAAPAPAPEARPRYTFAWPLVEPQALRPRGGTTQGVPVTVDRAPSVQWQVLQATESRGVERDRRAILAMAGTYRVSFDFLETVPFDTDSRPKVPYQSWGTEKIYVDRNEPQFISLVHILEMRMKTEDGGVSEPLVTKHWRQDWRYEPPHIVEFQGRDRWQRRELAPSSVEGMWLQTVYQVDESPRYASIGRWQHTASFSTWLSGETWRPLPRREWSVRDDYHVLIGTNRHTITALGWVQEENNLKGVLTADRQLDREQPFLAREYGVARYERIRGLDFSAADRYYERTRDFWNEVRETWGDTFETQDRVTLRGPVDQLGLFIPLFEHAEAIASGAEVTDAATRRAINDALENMGAIR